MTKIDREQLHKLYDYMAKNKLYLKPDRVCKMCHKNQEDVEFAGCADVCAECYTEYVKLTKKEKRELGCC